MKKTSAFGFLAGVAITTSVLLNTTPAVAGNISTLAGIKSPVNLVLTPAVASSAVCQSHESHASHASHASHTSGI